MLKLTDLSRRILLQRGIGNPEAWVSPDTSHLASPDQFPGMEERAHWWINSLRSRKPILLFGDYDVDGITSCAIASTFLQQCGLPVQSFIPSRIHDGYGLTASVLGKFDLSQFGGLLVMDSGTTAHQALDAVNRSGLPTLVIDHHSPDESTREYSGIRIINPRVWGGGSPCSAMLVYQFCACVDPALLQPEFLGLAALAGVADSIPINAENHAFIKLGLPALEHSKAVRIMGEELGFGLVTRELASWQIAPRINAAGRMGNAQLALDFLLRPTQAGFQMLEAVNQERRKLQDEVLAQAQEQAAEQNSRDQGILFVHGAWHPGVLGIVASKLVELYRKPAIAAGEAEVCQGSGRSPAGIDLLGTLRQTTLDPTWYGGHSAAIGIRVPFPRLAEVKSLLSEVRPASSNKPGPSAEILISTPQVNRSEAYAIDCLEPFGPDFPSPVLGIKGTLQETNGQWSIQDEFGRCPAINPQSYQQKDPVITFQMTMTTQGTTARILPS